MWFCFPFLIPEKCMFGLKFYAKKTLFVYMWTILNIIYCGPSLSSFRDGVC